MKTISILAQKGGTGKTAITTHLGASLVKKGYRVLIIDLDPQTNLTSSYHLENDYTIHDFLSGDLKNFNLNEKEGIYFLCGDKKIWNEVWELESLKEKLNLLANQKINGKPIDYCLIDCSPSPPIPRMYKNKPMHSLNGNALYASDYVLCPINTSQHSVQSMMQLWGDIQEFQKNYNSKLKLLGFVLNRIIEKRVTVNFWKNTIKEKLKSNLLFASEIHESVEVEKATQEGSSVFVAFPNGRTAKEFKKLTKEFIKKTL